MYIRRDQLLNKLHSIIHRTCRFPELEVRGHPQPKGRKVVGLTTIFELVEMMDGPSGRAKSKVPSAAWVRRHGGAVLDSAVLSDPVPWALNRESRMLITGSLSRPKQLGTV